ncbi:MAG: homocysteine S-methyltransferase family protein [Fimbriimonadaceae bacterium]|nr:homocysteine S-methyltransferase family protein [Fimbriimonadaceae bacterium]
MNKSPLHSEFLEALGESVLIWDGAFGTQVQNRELPLADYGLDNAPDTLAVQSVRGRLGDTPLEGCTEILNLTRPDVMTEIHESYLAAGSDIIETNSFGATSIVMAEYDAPELVADIARAAGDIAVAAAKKFSESTGRRRFVAGGLGPGTKLVTLGQTTWEALENTYTEAFIQLIASGVDVLLLETLQDLLMVKAGLVSARRAMAETGQRLPIIVQVTMEQTGTMLLGSEIGAALNLAECFPEVVAFGMNCATGPVEMAEHARFLGANSTRPLSIQPNAGLPMMEKGHAVYKLTPEELADHHDRFISEFGAALVGGCCGTTPHHIEAVVAKCGGRNHNAPAHWQGVRNLFSGFDFEIRTPEQGQTKALQGASSLYQFVPYQQDNSFLIVGERTNANGSKAFREMLAAENWDGLVEMARDTEAEGSHLLDVCTAYVGRDEARDMTTLLRLYNQHVTVPIMIDSTEVPVVEAALKHLAGKPIINSINFEDGEERTRRVLELCQTYGAAVVALTINEQGMAKSVEDKVAIAERILALTREYGLPDHDVFFDCLTFTLGSGDEEFRKSAIATINAIRILKERYPAINTILGVSNVSFGLKASSRMALNSVFLHYAQEAGLDAAIVHFSKIRPESQISDEIWKVASDLVFDRREYAMSV